MELWKTNEDISMIILEVVRRFSMDSSAITLKAFVEFHSFSNDEVYN